MGKVKKAFGAFLVPLLSVLLAFLIGGIIMAALGANPFLAVKFLFQGAFGSKAGIGTTLTKATPLIFTALARSTETDFFRTKPSPRSPRPRP